MWESPPTNYPPETLPWGVRRPPPRLPPAPPGTAGALPNFGKPEPLPYTLRAALRECLGHARSLRLLIRALDEPRHAGPELSFEVVFEVRDVQTLMWNEEMHGLRASFDCAMLRLIRSPEHSPDADHPRTKTRLLHVIRAGAHLDSHWQMLEQRSLFGEITSPQTALTAYRIRVPANCPEWALELLPPRSVVRWMMEGVDRALRLAENYWSLERFDANIAVPLAALTAALPSSP